MKKIPLGSTVKDLVTGLEGIATSRIEYLNGCVQYGVHPKVGADGKPADPVWVDVGQLRIVNPGISKEIEVKDTGGRQATPKLLKTRMSPGR